MLLTKNRLVTCKYGIFLVQHLTSEQADARRSLWACGTRSVFMHTPIPWLHAAKRLCLRYSKKTHKFLPFFADLKPPQSLHIGGQLRARNNLNGTHEGSVHVAVYAN